MKRSTGEAREAGEASGREAAAAKAQNYRFGSLIPASLGLQGSGLTALTFGFHRRRSGARRKPVCIQRQLQEAMKLKGAG